MSTTCEITFDKPHRVYFAGQFLRGSVRLTTNNVKVCGVYIHIFGNAYACWSELCTNDHSYYYSSRRSREFYTNHYVYYTGNEVYLDQKTYFVGGPNDCNVRLIAQTQTYNFECHLPEWLPTSFVAPVGCIRYFAQVVIDNQFLTNSKFREETFTVVKVADVTANPNFRTPAMCTKEKCFYPLGLKCFSCCSSGVLKFTASTQVSGYTPGQTIHVNVSSDNRSNQSISSFTVELVQIRKNFEKKRIEKICKLKQVSFIGIGMHEVRYSWNPIYVQSSKWITNVLAWKKIPSNGRRTHNISIDLKVPPCSQTDFSSNVIHIGYAIRVTVAISSSLRKNFVVNWKLRLAPKRKLPISKRKPTKV